MAVNGTFTCVFSKVKGLSVAKAAPTLYAVRDINTLEPLSRALEVSVLELMQIQPDEDGRIDSREVERLVKDTIGLAERSSVAIRAVGGVNLAAALKEWFCRKK